MSTKHSAVAPPPPIERVIAAYEGFMHRLMATHAPEMNAIDLTMAQTKALYVVYAAGELRMTELATRLGVTSSTATGQADRLVELGLLERLADPHDRRQVVVRATPEATASLEHFRELNTRRMRDLLSRLSADDLAVVERSITVLAEAMDEDVAATQPPAHPSRHQ
jgi:DNA-binding MarR family transcriptional regulator